LRFMRRFYASIEQFQTKTVTLGVEETRHLRDVLRLKETDKVKVFDGEGREFLCEIEKIEKKESSLKIIEEVSPTAPESDLDLTLAVALLKGEKFDLVVQKAVELGVSRLVPLNTKRADVKLKETEKRLERWRKIALEAAKQSGRARLMRIDAPIDFEKFIESANGTRILFAERNGESFSAVKESKKIVAAIGAEGGWEDAEIEAARKNGFQIVTLRGRILRAETAAISIAAILQNRFGDLI
ncbi:MAG TPA: 16S rRNA (uracil(1498)-N(3))-methyltransferase, partial [Pyrinomonadaceae bacterium]|nr:16S rRNA (uracil(1498)-N(3))-methyltransferase [Pyrinomonadaceae bacterium]